MPAGFIHLHVHSEYSLTDSTIRVGGLVDACVRARMPAVALTDQSNLFALVKFYRAAEGAGIKPIAGSDLWIANPEDRGGPQRLTVLCQNREGYLNLSRLLTRAYAENWRGDHVLVDAAWFDGANAGLVAPSEKPKPLRRAVSAPLSSTSSALVETRSTAAAETITSPAAVAATSSSRTVSMASRSATAGSATDLAETFTMKCP